MVVYIFPSNAKTLLGLCCNSNCIHLCSHITLSFRSVAIGNPERHVRIASHCGSKQE